MLTTTPGDKYEEVLFKLRAPNPDVCVFIRIEIRNNLKKNRS